VTAWDVLEHCADPKATLRVIVKLLKPGGMFVRVPDFSFMQDKLPTDFAASYLKWIYPLDPDQRAFHFTPRSLQYFFNELGLTIVQNWQSQDDEYTPRLDGRYPIWLKEMSLHKIACEMNFLVRYAVQDNSLQI